MQETGTKGHKELTVCRSAVIWQCEDAGRQPVEQGQGARAVLKFRRVERSDALDFERHRIQTGWGTSQGNMTLAN